jgi:hypothetical protein
MAFMLENLPIKVAQNRNLPNFALLQVMDIRSLGKLSEDGKAGSNPVGGAIGSWMT